MLDGLEIQEKKFSEILDNKDSRIDSQFWTNIISYNTNYTYVKIGRILKQAQYGISVEMNENGVGYPIYRMNEIHDSICDLDVKKYADITPQEFELFKLHNGDLLFNRTNSYEWVGRTGIYYKAAGSEEKVFASYLVRLIPDAEQVLPEYLTAFLNTANGIRQIKARARQSINQTNVNLEEVKEIELPLLGEQVQIQIQNNYIAAHANLIASQKAYKQAEKLLNEYLGVPEKIENSCAVKTLIDSFIQSGRLDAEYYQPKYDEMEQKIKSCNHCVLKEIAEVKNGEFVEETAYSNIGIDYIRGADITDHVVDNSNAVKVNIFAEGRKTITYNDLAFAMIGSVGNVAINKSHNIGLVSNNLGIISPENKNLSNYILLYLSSNVGKMLFEKYQTRTAQPKIRKEDVENFLIPILSEERQKEICDLVQEFFVLRRQSKQLLANAIKAVEMAIDKDEETAVNWLKQSYAV